MKLLLHFYHGLGDCVQETIVLKHLRHYYPDAFIGIVAKQGQDNIFYGLADCHWPLCHPQQWRMMKWDLEIDVVFRRPTFNYLAAPSTKISESLITEFGLQPIPELFAYEMVEQPGAAIEAINFLESIPRPVLIHGFSEFTEEDKQLTEEECLFIGEQVIRNGATPVFIDFANQLKLHRGNEAFKFLDAKTGIWGQEEKNRWGNAQVLRELIKGAQSFIGIDSGPSHLAATTSTPTTVIWKRTNPAYCFDPAPNVIHLLPDYFEALFHPRWKQQAIEYFNANYNARGYGDDLKGFLAKYLYE